MIESDENDLSTFLNDEIFTFFLQRSISFRDYLQEFGVGLLLLPCLVLLLKGKLSVKHGRDKKKLVSQGGSIISARSYISNNDVSANGERVPKNLIIAL